MTTTAPQLALGAHVAHPVLEILFTGYPDPARRAFPGVAPGVDPAATDTLHAAVHAAKVRARSPFGGRFEGLTLCDVFTIPVDPSDHAFFTGPGPAMAEAVRAAAAQPHHNARWGCDFDALAAACAWWAPQEAFVVRDAISAWHRIDGEPVTVLHTVGLCPCPDRTGPRCP
ncbi:hypothetical protein [Nocardia sp. alder85J]|uniref:hypothetical protein n=1 Tax=Nocardia sp. alder85J TaxID=2862949 RepID=UPI001CD59EDD|nr:hypothetical protein [Nocardia sp. alder85J]MCX4097739.1 hypothetical protein [Nocardia sp. alder85J]